MTLRVKTPRWIATAALAGSVIFLSACGSTGSGTEPAEEPAESTSAEASAPPSPSSSPSASATPEPAPAPAPAPSESASSEPAPTPDAADGVCAAAMLEGAIESPIGGGAAGSVYRNLILTNVSNEECIMSGFPGVSYVDASGTQIGAPADREDTGAEILLAPGASAVAELKQTGAENYGGDCSLTEATGLRVYPPEATDSLIVAQKSMACASESIVLMTVSAMQPSA